MTEIIRIDRQDPRYPRGLRRLDDAPPMLHLCGALPGRPGVAMVGSRAATRRAVDATEQLAGELAVAGQAVISGGALGVDAAAHRGALDSGGITVAVFGSGLRMPYPARNLSLFREILASGGALASELPDQTPPRAWHFPRRNRLVAAFAEGVVVTEAGPRSGSLHTASWARRLGLPVMALAGSPGCDTLLRHGALAVRDAADVLAGLRGELEARLRHAPDDPDLARLVDLMGDGEERLDDLAGRAGWSTGRTAMVLVRLDLERWVEPLGGGRYRKV